MRDQRNLIVVVFTGALAACGGGTVQSIPAPVVSIPATPPPPPPTPPPANPPALKSNEPFATVYVVRSNVSEGPVSEVTQTDPSLPLNFKYDAASDRYVIALPGLPEGRLSPIDANAYGSTSNILTPQGPLDGAQVYLSNPGVAIEPHFELTYIGWGNWSATTDRKTPDARSIVDHGKFAYGIPTPTGGAPVTGSANYEAKIRGIADYSSPEGNAAQDLVGSVSLNFDFSKGSLAGYMEPYLASNGFAPYEGKLGRFDFSHTVYSIGNTTFSGSFLAPGQSSPAGEFAGAFMGPQAQELLARFSTKFTADMRLMYTGADRIDRLDGTLTGIWIGKKN